MADDPYRFFRLEAREILDQFGAATLELEKSGSATPVPLLLRLAHTLKGAARVVKQPEIADAAHAIEEALAPYREARDGPPRDRIDAVLWHLEGISCRVGRLGLPADAEPTVPDRSGPASPVRRAGEDPARSVRADIGELDSLRDNIAETHALIGGLRATLRSVAQLRGIADLVAEQLAPRRGTRAPRDAAAARAYALADDLRDGIGRIERDLDSTIDQIDRELRQSRDAAEELRLVRIGLLFTALERTARDTARELGKEIVFEAKGGEMRIDADVLAAVQTALVQLVRNAIAHGIESPIERTAAGKPSAGRIALDISRQGRRMVFACHDDGRGIDLDAVRRAAQRRGVAAASVARMDAQGLIGLLLQGGLTTSAAVTEIAGRGVGLDVVRAAAERLGGALALDTDPGKGTRFELAVPLSLVSTDALVVENGGVEAVVPLDAVRNTVLLAADEVSHAAGGATVLHDARAIPFLWLPRLFNGGRLPVGRKLPAVIVDAPAGRAAVGVDRLVGVSRAVVRLLPQLAPAGPIVAGATLDADGNSRIVLSPEGLRAAAMRDHIAEPQPEPMRHPVLVVDDSLTTRMLEQSILESAGYEVDLATSAEEGLEMAGRRRYALFLVDVEMPGMDGFGFITRVRADPALHEIPAVLVTSRDAPEDRLRGRDVGAHGYVVKGEFDQAELLATIRSLVA